VWENRGRIGGTRVAMGYRMNRTLLPFVILLAACSPSSSENPPPVEDGGTDATSTVDSGHDAEPNDAQSDAPNDAHEQVDCGAMLYLPPIIIVQNTGFAPTCDVTFTVEAADGGTAPQADATLCPANVGGCPETTGDAAAPAECIFVLEGLLTGSPSTKYTVDVSKSGYATTPIQDVHAGTGGCVIAPPSTSSITLSTISDAGHD
jgi:hypothetical protein